MNTKGLERIFLKNAELCYLNGDDTACDVVADLINVFYELGNGHKVGDLMQEAKEKGVD